MKKSSNIVPKRQLSSLLTFVVKVILPTIFYGGLLFALYALTSAEQYLESIAALFVLLTFGTLIYFAFVRLKAVDLDHEYFYISNYLKTIKVPVRELQEVTQLAIPGNYRPIFLYFKSSTEFGTSVMFLNSFESTFSMSESSVVEELRSLIEA